MLCKFSTRKQRNKFVSVRCKRMEFVEVDFGMPVCSASSWKQTVRFDGGKEALVTFVQFDLNGILCLIGKLSGFQLNFHANDRFN